MTSSELFEIVAFVRNIGPILITLSVLIITPKKLNYLLRALAAIILAWIFIVLFTIYVYNPVGVEMGHEEGMHFPENRFDNNTIASTVLAGWVNPTLVAIVTYVILRIIRRVNSLREKSNNA